MVSIRSVRLLAFPACKAMIMEDSSLLQSQRIETAPLEFDEFMQTHGRNYDSDDAEYNRRHKIFTDEMDRVVKINSRPDRLWTAGINHMSDWTPEEFKRLLGWRGHAHKGNAGSQASFLQSEATVETEVHLWDMNLVGEVADQGHCGSCWAVAASKMLEANFRIHTGSNRTFSAQEIVDCTPNPMSCGGTGGCEGATVELAMAQAGEHGLSTNEDIPYFAQDRQCMNTKGKISIFKDTEAGKGLTMKKLNTPEFMWMKGLAFQQLRLQFWHRLPVNSEEGLRAALLKGTVAVSVDASNWNRYYSGIFDECSRDATINHAVVAVGFGKEDDTSIFGTKSVTKYWTILNSWSRRWGEEGRIRLLRSDDKYCGTDYQPGEGTACKGGPSTVSVCGMCGVFYDSVFAQFV